MLMHGLFLWVLVQLLTCFELLLDKPVKLKSNPFINKWLFSFLTNHTQCVKVNDTLSDVKSINIGAPQGCVCSPILFTLFTNDCFSRHKNNYIFKYFDDTVILSGLEAKICFIKHRSFY